MGASSRRPGRGLESSTLHRASNDASSAGLTTVTRTTTAMVMRMTMITPRVRVARRSTLTPGRASSTARSMSATSKQRSPQPIARMRHTSPSARERTARSLRPCTHKPARAWRASHRSIAGSWTNHDAFGYFGDAYGLNFIAPAGVSTGGEPNAADIARLIEQIRREKIRAIFIENISDARLLQQIAQETGVRIGGRVFSDALSDADGPAPTYIKMFHHNLDAFALALSS